ncbi:hypothetical protein BD626DRAFT_211910 [Schizophyllum amplum]|uniref:Karyogamy protein 5 n=1 Tax=Schizophyllum amplum TaxID=97359 RepID=A0A550BY72_9AGAR|nr:hypothetical protein BD626DRAFT_211910 [Auriculariopsis ampla]
MHLLLLSLLCASRVVDALFWPVGRTMTDAQHGVSNAEIAAIGRSQSSLDAYARRPDCFKDSAALISARCEDLDARENERVRAAISMTLCELATAKHHTPPLECAPFAAGAHDAPESAVGECVNALSRSAQYWSSYSGYLREIPQLCFAYRRWHDIDTAKDIYRNATLRELDLLHALDERGLQQAEALAIFGDQLLGMRNALSDLATLSQDLNALAHNLPAILKQQAEEIITAFSCPSTHATATWYGTNNSGRPDGCSAQCRVRCASACTRTAGDWCERACRASSGWCCFARRGPQSGLHGARG